MEHPLFAARPDQRRELQFGSRSRGNGTPAKPGDDEYYRTTPLFANGRILTVATTRRDAFAIDPGTGKTLWHWTTDEGLRWRKAPREFAGRGLA